MLLKVVTGLFFLIKMTCKSGNEINEIFMLRSSFYQAFCVFSPRTDVYEEAVLGCGFADGAWWMTFMCQHTQILSFYSLIPTL